MIMNGYKQIIAAGGNTAENRKPLSKGFLYSLQTMRVLLLVTQAVVQFTLYHMHTAEHSTFLTAKLTSSASQKYSRCI